MKEVTEQMLAAAVKKAVDLKIIPSHFIDESEYLRHWANIKAIVQAALDKQE
jgi:hypothetical protein